MVTNRKLGDSCSVRISKVWVQDLLDLAVVFVEVLAVRVAQLDGHPLDVLVLDENSESYKKALRV